MDMWYVLCGVRAELVCRVVQKEMSIFWELVVSATVRKEARMNICLILNGHRGGAV